MSAMAGPTGKPQGTVTTSTGILVFDDVEELDFIGPWEVFSVANRLFPGSFSLGLLSTGQPTIRARYGLNLEKIDSVYEALAPHLLVLPGGPGRQIQMQDVRLLDYLKQVHKTGTLLASVCTGAFMLAEAGLLRMKTATTHWSALDELRTYPDVAVVERRFVDQGDIVTSAGISAGIDMALHIVARFHGAEAAHEVAHRMEYVPSQPIE